MPVSIVGRNHGLFLLIFVCVHKFEAQHFASLLQAKNPCICYDTISCNLVGGLVSVISSEDYETHKV